MLKEESVWIKATLHEANISAIKDVIDIGSSTKQFRTQIQPYIDENIFRPLREKDILISYLDKKDAKGVDYVCDVENITVNEIRKKFDLVICCNLLEHVSRPEHVCSLLMSLVKESGFLLVTVAQSYRYHPDPIDTMFRPSMDGLISMFPGVEILRKKVICIKDKMKYKKGELLRYFFPFLNWKVNCLFMKTRQ